MIKQVYAVFTRINYAPLHMEIFCQQENAIRKARSVAYEKSKAASESDLPDSDLSKIYGEIYGPEAKTLVTKARHLSFPNVIYAAVWGPTENIAFVSTFDIQDNVSPNQRV